MQLLIERHSSVNHQTKIGCTPSCDGEFINPNGVCCYNNGTVCVADYWNHRVQVFTAEGQFVRKFVVMVLVN